ncbi:MAG: cupin domain-containing protein [Prevotella sp.]|jgi:quercetin dioxygenase-like cupin family protein|nr:cupin domain-containing protein [Prevotella sp.]
MSIQSKAFFVADDEPIYPAGDRITRQFVGYNDNIMMVKVVFEKGAEGTPHSHPHVQTSYIASGKFEVTVGGKKDILQTGDGFFVAPDVPHGCICLEAGIIIDVFNPVREDFLAEI